ncbi:MAG TPA: hypothetical protein VHG08_18295 [Longimicrobium sp.]|nr:hypothetical protein [Longimicrobium sp.]
MKLRITAAAALACVLAASPAAAQTDTLSAPGARTNAISILPLHAILGFYAGDYEHAVGRTTTVGLGASYFSLGEGEDELVYATTEAKFRYYPSGDPLRGLSFGLTAGPTFLSAEAAGSEDESVTAIGVGFEVARSHVLGVDRRFYYGYGAGAKRLFFTGDEADGAEMVLPTLRLSVGYAF